VATCDDLGLGLVELGSVETAAETLLQEAKTVSRGSAPPAPDDRPPLDQVLWALRQLFKARYAGWTPTLGKNRRVEHVYGQWAVIHGGDGDPKAHDDPTESRTRATGPGAGIRIGVLDSAFYPQLWLAGGWTARFSDILGPSAAQTAAQGHATFVTGLILSQAPGATVEIRRVLDPDGRRDSWEVAEEIVRFGRTGLDVLNLSLTSRTEDDDPPLVLATAIDRLDPNIVVVAAAGNYEAGCEHDQDKRNRPSWPAALDDVIAVGAATEQGDIASFSPDAPWVDVIAPGENVVSTYLETTLGEVAYQGWASWSGTSFAAGLFSGAVAAGAVPNRISGAQSAHDILETLKNDQGLPFAGQTHAKCLPLRVW
jgi:subtilisin family serine protease